MTVPAVPPGGCELSVNDLSKSFGPQVVLRRLTLTVPAGSLTAILGPSGSGKTTLLRVLAGFERADGGSVVLGGVVVDDRGTYVPPDRRRVGYVPQEGALFPHLTVARNVAFGLHRSQRRRERVDGLLALVGMEEMGARYPHQLSGGQQQRVALARALAVDPALVLLDEPFSSLDAALRASVRAEVRSVLRASGATALLVTHDQDEALSWADQVAVLRDGGVGQLGTPHALYRRPVDPDVACFVGDANLLSGVATSGGVRTALGTLTVDEAGCLEPTQHPPAGTPMTVLVRPEQVELSVAGDRSPATGTVLDYRYFGHDAVVSVGLVAAEEGRGSGVPGAGAAPLVVRVMGDAVWPTGAAVGLAVRGAVLAWPAAAVAPTVHGAAGDPSAAATS